VDSQVRTGATKEAPFQARLVAPVKPPLEQAFRVIRYARRSPAPPRPRCGQCTAHRGRLRDHGDGKHGRDCGIVAPCQIRAGPSASQQAALEITALLQRTYGVSLEPGHLIEIADKIERAITAASDAHIGLLRHVAKILTPAVMNAEGSGAAIVRTVTVLRDPGFVQE
jgi:hypothetical protein